MMLDFQEAFQKLMKKLDGWLDGIILALPNILLAIVVLTASLFAARFLKSRATRALQKLKGHKTVINVIANLLVAAFMVLAIFMVLSILNLDDAFTALLGTAGIIGLAIGLALQDPLINLFSGILMSVRDSYQIGDLVETNGYFGSIQKITLRTTMLRTPEGQDVIIPNKDVIQKPLVNYTRSGERRVDLECGISYGDDLEEVREIAMEAIRQSEIDLKDGKPLEFFFKEFGDSSINFVLRFWLHTTTQGKYLMAKSQAIVALKKAFDLNGITIPFPIRTLDFGIVGGVRLDDLYPSRKHLSVLKNKLNTNHKRED